MAQFRLIIMHPQMNATFMRRLIGIGDTLKTEIECHATVANTLTALTPNQSASLIIPKSHINSELSELCDHLKVPVVAWELDPSFNLNSNTANQWHCIGDPFSGVNFQSSLFLVTKTCEKNSKDLLSHDDHTHPLSYWMNRRKWGDVLFEFSSDSSHSILEFRNIMKKLKWSNHQNIQAWQSMIESYFSSTPKNTSANFQMSCDGNRIKMYWDVQYTNQNAFQALIQGARKLYDSTVLLEVANDKLRMYCELSVSDIGNGCPSIVVWGAFNSKTKKTPTKLEDAG